MASTLSLIRYVSVQYDAPNGGALNLYTDLPVPNTILTLPLPATSGRREFRLRLPGTCRAKLVRPEVLPSGIFRLYAMSLYARTLPGDWRWIQVPVVATPEEWSAIKLPIPPTPDEWSPLPLPVHKSEQVAEWRDLPMDAIQLEAG